MNQDKHKKITQELGQKIIELVFEQMRQQTKEQYEDDQLIDLYNQKKLTIDFQDIAQQTQLTKHQVYKFFLQKVIQERKQNEIPLSQQVQQEIFQIMRKYNKDNGKIDEQCLKDLQNKYSQYDNNTIKNKFNKLKSCQYIYQEQEPDAQQILDAIEDKKVGEYMTPDVQTSFSQESNGFLAPDVGAATYSQRVQQMLQQTPGILDEDTNKQMSQLCEVNNFKASDFAISALK